jgi:DNA-binding transcriptional MerR regulator
MMVAMTSYAPAEAAKRTGLSLDTLRYYERLGLTGPIRRTTGGKRVYSEHDIAWFNLLTCLRRAGLGIADLQRFIGRLRGVSNGNHQSPNGSSDDSAEGVVELLERRRADLTAQMEQMQTALRVLDGKIAHYRRLARSG